MKAIYLDEVEKTAKAGAQFAAMEAQGIPVPQHSDMAEFLKRLARRDCASSSP